KDHVSSVKSRFDYITCLARPDRQLTAGSTGAPPSLRSSTWPPRPEIPQSLLSALPRVHLSLLQPYPTQPQASPPLILELLNLPMFSVSWQPLPLTTTVPFSQAKAYSDPLNCVPKLIDAVLAPLLNCIVASTVSTGDKCSCNRVVNALVFTIFTPTPNINRIPATKCTAI
ncbi:Oxidoreductase protein family, partial [Pyrenophora tritici-repentis]